ncbi:MAG: glycoside hydrolase 5 family protein, partial [Planctomycetota bacterium]
MFCGRAAILMATLGCVATSATGAERSFPQRMHVRNGVLYYEDGSEVALWGVNFQPCLYWEYRAFMGRRGVPMEIGAIRKTTDESLDEVVKMGGDVIRAHLTPADFTDSGGNLVDNIWLDALDYMIAAARRRKVYVYLTFLNHMNSVFVKGSFAAASPRHEWTTDPAFIAKSRNYIRRLLDHENRYTRVRLKDDPVVAVLGLINEPRYPDYNDPKAKRNNELFQAWRTKHGKPDGRESYADYRRVTVKQYIDDMRDLVRKTGAQQPVVWNCNWPGMIRGREDVFQGIAESKADAVAFCLYPGQSRCKSPPWANPEDLSVHNFLPYIEREYKVKSRLGWIREDRFRSKAKMVYEFETWYNYTTYTYPALAKVFRSLGVQIAPMWTYTLTNHAVYKGGSHTLSLKCTPRKAASFAVAGEVFRGTERLVPYRTSAVDEDVFDGCALSFKRDLSVAAFGKTYIHTGDVTDEPIPPPAEPRRIVGYGSSRFVKYEGAGIYFISIGDDRIDIEIMPHASFKRERWRPNRTKEPVTAL